MNNKRCSAVIVRRVVVDITFIEDLLVNFLVKIFVGTVVRSKKQRERDIQYFYRCSVDLSPVVLVVIVVEVVVAIVVVGVTIVVERLLVVKTLVRAGRV